MGGEEGAILQPGDHCGWRASGDTGQSAGLLRVGQVGDGRPNWRKERTRMMEGGRKREGGREGRREGGKKLQKEWEERGIGRYKGGKRKRKRRIKQW